MWRRSSSGIQQFIKMTTCTSRFVILDKGRRNSLSTISTWRNNKDPSPSPSLHSFPYFSGGRRFIHVGVPLRKEVVVNVPNFAESITEGDVKWLKAKGDTVEGDEAVAEIETDKTSVPVPAPGKGVIEELYAEDGATVKPGQKLFKIKME